jgi:hypothetical protein
MTLAGAATPEGPAVAFSVGVLFAVEFLAVRRLWVAATVSRWSMTSWSGGLASAMSAGCDHVKGRVRDKVKEHLPSNRVGLLRASV